MPAGAFAGSVARSGATINYTAASGEANVVTVTQPNAATLVVRDTGIGSMTDADGVGGCAVIGNRADCPAAGVTRLVIATNDLNDSAVVSAALTTLTNDLLDGGLGTDSLAAGAGTDTLRGNDGNDTLRGDDGNDVLDGGTGPDVMIGGAQTDNATYATRTTAVNVRINNVADDGDASDGAGTRDDVRTDVENVTGGSGADTITGSVLDNSLAGGAGVDTLRGSTGTDRLIGGTQDDVLDGGTGPDDTFGGSGLGDRVTYSARTVAVDVDLYDVADDGEAGEKDNIHSDVEEIIGGQASDFLVGDADANRLYGGGGGDDLLGEGGPDFLYGQADSDFLWAGPGDDVLDVGQGANQFDAGDGDDMMLQGATPNAGDTFSGAVAPTGLLWKAHGRRRRLCRGRDRQRRRSGCGRGRLRERRRERDRGSGKTGC